MLVHPLLRWLAAGERNRQNCDTLLHPPPWLDIRVAVTEPCGFTLTTYPLRPSPAITTKPYSRRRKKADDPDSPYLLIHRQFEDLDDHLCYVETHDEKYVGHFLLRRVELTLHGLSIELDRPNDNLRNVSFTIEPSDLEEALHW